MGRRHRDYKAEWEAAKRADEKPAARMCATAGKRMYANEAEAQSTAAHQMEKGGAAVQLRVYLCVYCGAWHLTSKG